MRIGLVTTLERGGPVEHAVLLARDLHRAGHDVTAVVPDAAVAARFAHGGGRPVVAPVRAGADARGGVALRRALRGVDITHSHDRRAGLWAALTAPRGGVRVHSLHGLPDAYLPGPRDGRGPGLRDAVAYRGVERTLAQRAAAIVVPSAAARNLLVERLGYDRDRLTVVPNAVDERPAVPRDGRVVGTLSALEPVKGLDVFLRAAALVARPRPDARFALHGTGSQEGALRALATELGLADRVTFAGHVPADEALARLAVFVLPSYMETSGIALMEAMAAGLPSVATTVGGVPETAAHGGVELVGPGDPDALALAIGRILDDPEHARALATRAREAVARTGGPAETARRMAALYESVLER